MKSRSPKPLMLLLTVLVCLAPAAKAASYYVDAVAGSDDNPGTRTAPWRTITGPKGVNARQASLQPGDSVLFHCGQVFQGPLIITKSGTATARITYGAYSDTWDSGTKPVISGLITIDISRWAQVSNPVSNFVYEAACPEFAGTRLNIVSIDDQPRGMGHYPRGGAFRAFTAISPTGANYSTVEYATLTDKTLPFTQDYWKGAEVVIRKRAWIMDYHPITAQASGIDGVSGAITYQNTYYDYEESSQKHSAYAPSLGGYGYFIQNHPATLYDFSNWCFNPVSKKLAMCFDASGPRPVSISAVETLVNMRYCSNVVIDGLDINGANQRGIDVTASNNVAIRNSTVRQSGRAAIFGSFATGLTVENNVLDWNLNNGIHLGPATDSNVISNCVVTGNNITNTATMAGNGANGDSKGNAILFYAYPSINVRNVTISNNNILNTGYCGVWFKAGDITVQNNFIDYFNLVKDDGGGIYTYQGSGDAVLPANRKIIGNIVMHGKGQPAGTPGGDRISCGIYLDELTSNVEMSGNTVANNMRGIYLNDAYGVQISQNSAFCNKYSNSATCPTRNSLTRPVNVTASGNKYLAAGGSDPVIQISIVSQGANDGDVAGTILGAWDNNYYARPLNDTDVMVRLAGPYSGPKSTYTLPAWTSTFKQEAHSHPSPVRLKTYTITSSGPDMVGKGSFDSSLADVGIFGNGLQIDTGSGNINGTDSVHGTFSSVTTPIDPVGIKIATSGTLSNRSKYIVRFDALSAADGAFVVHLNDSAGNAISKAQTVNVTSDHISSYELLIDSLLVASSSSPQIYIECARSTKEFWIDNVSFKQVTYTNVTPDSVLRLEYATNAARTINLDQNYVDLTGAVKTGAVTLQPWTSLMLIKTDNAAPQGTVLPPVISPNGGTFYNKSDPITLSCPTAGASIYYSIDSGAAVPYTGPITLTSSGTIQAVATKAGLNDSSAGSASFMVITPPVIATQPANATVNAGANATFSVSASSSLAMTYQWRKNGTNIGGATAASYTTPPTTTADNGTTFDCVVSNAAGSVTSAAATLTVKSTVTTVPAPTIGPASSGVVYPGPIAVTLSCSVPVDAIYYTLNGSTPTKTVSATCFLYTGPFTISGNTTTVKAIAVSGTVTGSSATAYYTIQKPPVITQDPVSQTVTAGQSATFSVAVDSSPVPWLTYQWFKVSASGATIVVSGANKASYTVTSAQASDNGTSYYCLVKNASGSVKSAAALMTVK